MMTNSQSLNPGTEQDKTAELEAKRLVHWQAGDKRLVHWQAGVAVSLWALTIEQQQPLVELSVQHVQLR